MPTIISYVDLRKKQNDPLNQHLESTNSEKIALKMQTTSRCVLSV